MFSNKVRIAVASIAAAAAFAGAGAAAQAATVYNLDQPQCGSNNCGAGGTGTSYGTVTVTDVSSTDLHVVVQLATNVYFNYAGGSFKSVAFDLSGNPTVSFSGLGSNTGSWTGGGPGSYKEDGLGTFTYYADLAQSNNGGLPGNGIQTLTFDVTSSSPLTLVANPLSYFFGVDVATYDPETKTVAATGMVGALEGSTPGVPEPATWALMLIGVGGMGAILRRRRAMIAA